MTKKIKDLSITSTLLDTFGEEALNLIFHLNGMCLESQNLSALLGYTRSKLNSENVMNLSSGLYQEVGFTLLWGICERYLAAGLLGKDMACALDTPSFEMYIQEITGFSEVQDTAPPSLKVPSKSRRCTTDLLEFLRFFKGINTLATEVKYNACSSDVLAVSNSGKTVSEYEVKVSKEDFKKDFTKTLGYHRYGYTRPKHESYNDEDSTRFAPHYFWFVVPQEMVEFALEYLKDYPSYGLLSWDPEGGFTFSRRKPTNTKINLVRSASMIKKVSRPKASVDTLLRKIVMRATSELVKIRSKENLNISGGGIL